MRGEGYDDRIQSIDRRFQHFLRSSESRSVSTTNVLNAPLNFSKRAVVYLSIVGCINRIEPDRFDSIEGEIKPETRYFWFGITRLDEIVGEARWGATFGSRVSRYSWTRIGSFICAEGYLCVHAAALSISAYKFAAAHDCVINAQEKRVDIYIKKKKKKNDISIFIGLWIGKIGIVTIKLRNDSNVRNEHARHVDHSCNGVLLVNEQPMEFFCELWIRWDINIPSEIFRNISKKKKKENIDRSIRLLYRTLSVSRRTNNTENGGLFGDYRPRRGRKRERGKGNYRSACYHSPVIISLRKILCIRLICFC